MKQWDFLDMLQLIRRTLNASGMVKMQEVLCAPDGIVAELTFITGQTLRLELKDIQPSKIIMFPNRSNDYDTTPAS